MVSSSLSLSLPTLLIFMHRIDRLVLTLYVDTFPYYEAFENTQRRIPKDVLKRDLDAHHIWEDENVRPVATDPDKYIITVLEDGRDG